MKTKFLFIFIILIFMNITNVNMVISANNEIYSYNTKIKELTNSLSKYEIWISNNYMNRFQQLNGTRFSELYRGLTKYVSSAYLAKLNCVLSFLINSQNNWTWSSDDTGIHPHYNSHFAKNFFDAYLLTKNSSYLMGFKNTVEGLDFFFDGEKINPSWRSNLYAYTQLVLALNQNLLSNSSYYTNIANLIFNYSISFYNILTNE